MDRSGSGGKFVRTKGGLCILACGALATEIVASIRLNQWKNVDVQCLPADLHHRPKLIPAAVEKKLADLKEFYNTIVVAYGDCGTGGKLDEVLTAAKVERIEGPHCFAFYNGLANFGADPDDISTFYLTDFFCIHFDRFVWQAFGLDRRADMVDFVFGHYKKLVYLSQTNDPELSKRAREQASRLGLAFEQRNFGFGDLGNFVSGKSMRFQ